MAQKKKSAEITPEIDIPELGEEEFTACVLGTSPFVFHRMAEKARGQLLFPSGPPSRAKKASQLKHDPLAEYRSSVYRRSVNEPGPTRLLFPAVAFKRAMAAAALDIPSVAKAQIDRLTWAVGHRVDMYGVPQMLMDVVRNSDINHTPDIHTWATLPEWACRVTIRVAAPMLSAKVASRLLGAAGRIVGVGDGRPQKGKLSKGQFTLVNYDDETFQRVLREGGMAAQDAALENPTFFDTDTEDLYTWFEEEYKLRARNLKSTDEEEDENFAEAAE